MFTRFMRGGSRCCTPKKTEVEVRRRRPALVLKVQVRVLVRPILPGRFLRERTLALACNRMVKIDRHALDQTLL